MLLHIFVGLYIDIQGNNSVSSEKDDIIFDNTAESCITIDLKFVINRIIKVIVMNFTNMMPQPCVIKVLYGMVLYLVFKTKIHHGTPFMTEDIQKFN